MGAGGEERGGGGEGGYVKFFNEFAKQSKIEIENNIYINVNWVTKIHMHKWGNFNTTGAFRAIKVLHCT